MKGNYVIVNPWSTETNQVIVQLTLCICQEKAKLSDSWALEVTKFTNIGPKWALLSLIYALHIFPIYRNM